MPDAAVEPLLEVRNLRISFRTEDGVAEAVDDLSLTVSAGEILGIVGESGSGKTVSMMAVMRLIRDPNATVEGQVLYRGRDLMKLAKDEIRSIRGQEIAMIFQDPMTALTPVYTVGWHIAEQIRAHARVSGAEARARAIELLDEVGIASPDRRVDDYPHQFSGGMRQRVMIAIALSCNPALLIADEPTTALDVTIQAQILDLLKRLRDDHGSAIVLITHDMGVVASVAERVAVMYAGRVVEEAPRASLFRNPQHPYTWGLLGSMPRLDRPRLRRLVAIPGAPPSPFTLPEGCRFAPRCVHRFGLCSTPPELLARAEAGHKDACHLEVGSRSALRQRSLDAEAGRESA